MISDDFLGDLGPFGSVTNKDFLFKNEVESLKPTKDQGEKQEEEKRSIGKQEIVLIKVAPRKSYFDVLGKLQNETDADASRTKVIEARHTKKETSSLRSELHPTGFSEKK